MKKGWEYKKLGEVANVNHGKNQKEVKDVHGKYPIYGSGGNIMGYANNYLCDAGTTILGRKGTINNPIFIETKFWNVDTAFGISAKEGTDKKYIYYFVKSQDWSKKDTGTTLPSLTQKVVKDTAIPIPPLSEQQRIVSHLDSAFAKIDAVAKNAENSLNDAKALFQSALTKMMEPKEGWEEKTLENIVDKGTSISYGIVQPGNGVEEGVPVVRPVDLKENIVYSSKNLKRTTKEISDSYKRTILNGKEVLMCVRGTTGIISLSSTSLKGYNVTRGIVPIKIGNDILRSFVYYTLKAPHAVDFIQLHTKGAALKQINIADVKRIPIYVPSLSTQQSIVSALDSLRSKVDQLQSNLTHTLTECATLKQSILRETFE